MTNQATSNPNSPDGDFEIGIDGRITRADDTAHALLGFERPALIDRALEDILAPDTDTTLRTDRQRMSGNTVIRTEWRMRRQDGSIFHAEIIARGLEHGAMRFIARDATQLKAAEMTRAHLAAIVESSDDAIISKTLSSVVTTWNHAAERIFGYRADEMIGRSIRTLIPPDREAEEDDFLSRIGRGERVQNFETMRTRKDGTPAFVSVTVSPIFSDAGTIIGASKIARDISDQRLAKQQLRESEERFRTLADNISQFAWMADSKGWIFWYNQRWYDYTGTTLDEMQGWGWKKVHHPDHVDRVVERIQRSWDTGEPWEDTFPLRGTDGEYRWFLSRALPIRDEHGRIVRWFGTNTDVTEQKEREEQIRLLMREVNHRSKNMLALVQAIARQTASSSADDFLARFQERIQALSASQDLFVQSGWRGADIIELVKSQLGHFKDLIGDRIRLTGPSLVVTSAAAQAIGMVLHELGTNAGKYGALSNDTGVVRINWHEHLDAKDGRLFSMTWAESGGPRVKPPDRQGFGSVVIEKMVGVSLDAQSELTFASGGVQWQLQAPSDKVIQARPTRKRAATPDAVPATRKARRILVVEDDPVVALDLVERLQSARHQAIGPASTLDEAFALLGQHELDCAVLDVHLGSHTAEPLARKLRELAIPFITLSGYSAEQRPPIFRTATSLQKPVDTAQLLASIEKLFGR